jgi:2-polyprenyl-3-methyl-5-hydroxy-6-metoxy-1,4-benzoquinol methylase
VIEHLYHPLQVLKEAARVIKPGGKILVTTDNAFLLPALRHIMHRDAFVHEPVEGTSAMAFHSWRGHVRFFSSSDLETMLCAVGLQPIETAYYEVLYNSWLDELFHNPIVDMPKWQAEILAALPYLRNEVMVVAEKPAASPASG